MKEIYLIYTLLAVLGMIGAVAVAATIYWQQHNRAQRKKDEARFSADLFREQVDRERAVKKTKRHRDMMNQVLAEVQTLQEGIDSLLQLLTTAEITPGQQEWDTACHMVNEKSIQLADVLTVAMEMMYYEQQKRLERNDDIAVNDFCHDVFESCLPHLKEGVDPRLETSLPDDYIIRTDADTLKRILRNLLLNAMSNTSKDHISLAVAEDKAKVVFTVSDTKPCRNQLLHSLRVRTSKLMARMLGGALYMDYNQDGAAIVVFTITNS